MNPEEGVHLSTATGPLGTGWFLLKASHEGESRWRGQVWVTVLFIPVLPRQIVELRAASASGASTAAPCTVLSQSRLTIRDVVRGYARGIAALLGVAASWGVAYLNASNTSLPGGLGVIIGGLAPLALVAWLDGRIPRVTRAHFAVVA